MLTEVFEGPTNFLIFLVPNYLEEVPGYIYYGNHFHWKKCLNPLTKYTIFLLFSFMIQQVLISSK